MTGMNPEEHVAETLMDTYHMELDSLNRGGHRFASTEGAVRVSSDWILQFWIAARVAEFGVNVQVRWKCSERGNCEHNQEVGRWAEVEAMVELLISRADSRIKVVWKR